MKKNKHSSVSLLEIADNKDFGSQLTYKQILQALGSRAFGIVLLFFALPSALPFSAIPGLSIFFSVPILLIASQMVVARKTIWLPNIIAERTISHETISRVIHATVPYLIKVEYFLKPRLPLMLSPFMQIINGLVIFCLALLLMLPIPLSNLVFALLIIIFSLGLIEKDGVFLLLGYVGTVLYMSFVYLFIIKAIKLLLYS